MFLFDTYYKTVFSILVADDEAKVVTESAGLRFSSYFLFGKDGSHIVWIFWNIFRKFQKFIWVVVINFIMSARDFQDVEAKVSKKQVRGRKKRIVISDEEEGELVATDDENCLVAHRMRSCTCPHKHSVCIERWVDGLAKSEDEYVSETPHPNSEIDFQEPYFPDDDDDEKTVVPLRDPLDMPTPPLVHAQTFEGDDIYGFLTRTNAAKEEIRKVQAEMDSKTNNLGERPPLIRQSAVFMKRKRRCTCGNVNCKNAIVDAYEDLKEKSQKFGAALDELDDALVFFGNKFVSFVEKVKIIEKKQDK